MLDAAGGRGEAEARGEEEEAVGVGVEGFAELIVDFGVGGLDAGDCELV